MEYMNKYQEWLNSSFIDEEDKKILKEMSTNEKEIEESFYTDLAFGTGGMRGIRGVGTNRMNKYMIRKATQGLANYMLSVDAKLAKEKGVAIAYDCRIGSVEYSLNTALVLAANGIKAYLFDSLRSTPELSFAVRELGALAGIVVTASHNPVEYNGYKVYWEDGAQIVEPHASGVVNNVNEVKFEDIKLISEKEARESGLLVTINSDIDNKYIDIIKKESINIDIDGKGDFPIIYSPLHGTGRRPVQRALKEMGFDIITVREQEEPDGTFPTCSYANPEDPAVFELGIKLAEEKNSSIVMANDPDADRIGIAVKDEENNWIYPNGNQVGLLLMNYILKFKKDIPANGAVISTVVSTPMLDIIAKDHNVQIFRTLTGFKFIGEKIREFENGEVDGTYLFGFEESYGYLIGTHARDKDAVVSTLLIAEMACYYNSIGSSIAKELRLMYEKYGWYKEGINAVTMSGKEGAEKIANIMTTLRENTPLEVNGLKVLTLKDFELQQVTDIKTKDVSSTQLPKSNVIQLILEDGTHITARPSGTEPKIKYYFGVNADSKEAVDTKLEVMMKAFDNIIN